MQEYTGFDPQIGEITALRTFRIGPDGRLYPLYSDTAWVDGANTAHCNIGSPASSESSDLPPHAAPEPDCTCGYYAYGNESAARQHPHARHVLAVIACWGKTIAGTRGLRAQHARIEALWMSDSVPPDLTENVAACYPTTSVYADKSAMLTEHPPTQLDCYEIDNSRDRTRKDLGLRVAVFAALAIGSLPATWIWQHQDARLIWASEVCLFVVAALTLQLTRRDARSRSATVLYVAVTLWLIAPFAGAAGTLFLRLPILQIATLGLMQRSRLNREARRFPARIARLER